MTEVRPTSGRLGLPGQHDVPTTSGPKVLSPIAAICFLFLAVSTGDFATYLLKVAGLARLKPIVVDAGLYKLIFVFPLSLLFSRDLFDKSFWIFRKGSWKWICGLATVEGIVLLIPPVQPAVSALFAFHTIIVAPPVEEIVRTVVMRPLVSRWGDFWGIVVTSGLTALMHPAPKLVIVQAFALSIMLLYTKYSITSTALAHSLMNAICVLVGGIKPS